MKDDETIDKQIKQLIEKNEEEINAFKKLLENLEKTQVSSEGSSKRKKKSK